MTAEITVLGHRVFFTRRRYGGKHGTTYTWPHIFFEGEWYAIKCDPHPAVNWPRADLEKEVQIVIDDPKKSLFFYPAKPCGG